LRRGEAMKPLRLLGVAACFAALAASPARAADPSGPDEVPIEVTVLQTSDQPGETDPRCERFEKILRGTVAYGSLAILDVHKRSVPVNEVWTLDLPTQRTLQLRPLDVDREAGTLLSLDVEESVQGDFRVRRGQPLVVGGPRLGDGRLVVVVDTE
jgi:hypothetical protein